VRGGIAIFGHRVLFVALLGAVALGAGAGPAAADTSPTGVEYRPVTFPAEGKVSYRDDFGDCRSGCSRGHEGNDIMGGQMNRLLAAADGRVTFIRADASGSSGNMLTIKDGAGWSYSYMHINNDTPGTDDGANRREDAFAPGIEVGTRVTAGRHVAFMGDSGNAEGTQAHLHFEIHKPDGTPFSPFTSLRLSQGFPAGGLCRFPSNPNHTPDATANRGYWAVDTAGAVYTFGAANYFGGTNAGRAPDAPLIADLAPTPTGLGYWLVDRAGTVYPFGDAVQYGGMGGAPLNAPISAITPTGTGLGYWLLASDGGIFSFGDAAFYGSTGATPLNAPVIAMASTPTGRGYWLLASDGGIFSFGDAVFYGSTGATKLNAPVIGIATTGTGLGYWLFAKDGGVFTFGDATFKGSMPGTGWCDIPTSVSLTGSNSGRGYWVLLSDGRIVSFGDAVGYGEPKSMNVRALSIDVVP